jgi:hypothetical protein
MTIPTEIRRSRTAIWHGVFAQLQERYRKENQTIGWSCGQKAAYTALDNLWEHYARDVEDVREWLMEEGDHRIDRHKIIALTQLNIIELQPLVFVESNASDDDRYRLNVHFAHLFGLQFITRWNEVYRSDTFFTESFLYPFIHTKEGRDFQHEHLKLLMRRCKQPVSLFWASQLWFLFEQWGLSHMKYATRFPVVMESYRTQKEG